MLIILLGAYALSTVDSSTVDSSIDSSALSTVDSSKSPRLTH